MIFFLILTVRGDCHKTFPQKTFHVKKIYEGMELISEKMEALYAKLKQRMEAATSSYSVAGDFSQHIYFALVTRNHQNI